MMKDWDATSARPSGATISRRVVLLGSATMAAVPCGARAADDAPWEGRTTRLIVPFPAGGPTDIVARLVAAGMRERLKTNLIVENVGGAGGGIGMERLSRSEPDGLTTGMGSTGTHAINPHLYQRLPYDPEKGFTAISMVIEHINMLVLRGDHPARNLSELIAAARAGTVTYGSAGNGSSNHLSAELLALRAGVKMQHVPFRGSGPALTEVLAGRIDFMFDTPTSLPLVQGKGARIIAVTSAARHSLLPDVPAVSETIPGFEVIGWFGFFAPAGLPDALTLRLNRAMVDTLADADIRDRVKTLGLDPAGGTPGYLAERVRRDGALWGTVMREAGVSPI